MTRKEKDLIVRLISIGKNTYKDLSSALPNIEPKIWATMGHIEKMSPDDVACLDKKVDYIDALFGKCSLNDNDTFHLTVSGENQLYELTIQDKHDALSEKAIKLAEEANSLSETANKKADVSNTIAADSCDTSKEALKTSKDSKYISIIALIVATISLLYAIFGK